MEKDLKKLIHKYWNAGMNNGYWSHIESIVDEDIKRFCKKHGDKHGKQMYNSSTQ